VVIESPSTSGLLYKPQETISKTYVSLSYSLVNTVNPNFELIKTIENTHMKLKYTLTALLTTTLAGSAATILVNHGDPTSGLHTNHAGPMLGQTITSAATANSIDDVTFQLRDGTGGDAANGTLAYLHIYQGTTFNTATGAITSYGTFIGVSDNTQNIGADQTALAAITWNFTNQAVAASTQYNFIMSTSATGGSGEVGTGLELVAPGGYADGTALVGNNFHSTGLAWDLNFAANFNTDVVPEPSSTALLGLGGLALILRRRK